MTIMEKKMIANVERDVSSRKFWGPTSTDCVLYVSYGVVCVYYPFRERDDSAMIIAFASL